MGLSLQSFKQLGAALQGLGQNTPGAGMMGGAPNQYAFDPRTAYGAHQFNPLVPNFAPFTPAASPFGTPFVRPGTAPFGQGNVVPNPYQPSGIRPPPPPVVVPPPVNPTTKTPPERKTPDRGGGGGRGH